MKRIGMLTSGGDCQALNAAMRGVVSVCPAVGRTWKSMVSWMVIRDSSMGISGC